MLLDVQHLQTHFFTPGGVVKAVDGVSFGVKEGETVALVGESGCGKSVTALSIMQLIPNPPGKILNGRIVFKGRDLRRLNAEEMRKIRGGEMAMIFQEPMTCLNPVLTIGCQLSETMEEHLGLSLTEAESRSVEFLKLVGIPDPEKRLGQYPHQFSGGMRQRVMIAMALSCEPKLIIADEPTTALDVTIQAQILELLKKSTQRFKVGLIIITHNLGVVARYADRVNVMYAGKVVETGISREVYHRPGHPYTVGLLHSVPRLDQPRKAKLDPIGGQPPDLAHLPRGCSFKPRCKFARESCSQEIPQLRDWGAGHLSTCWTQDIPKGGPSPVERRDDPKSLDRNH